VSRVRLSSADEAALSGGNGKAARLAMRIVVAMAEASGADSLLDVRSAHVDGCLYHGGVSLDFAERLAADGAAVTVPTTLNVGSLDLLHPERFRGDAETARRARRLMDLYVAMGCRPSWTCAPYQVEPRPRAGEHVAWAESNAIAFVNSVVGARSERYGDFMDVCAAITGRVPNTGLHRTENRRGRLVFRLTGVPRRLLDEDVLYPVLGHLIGGATGSLVPVIQGLPSTIGEDRMKALGAAAASSGAVALFHVVGVTPEAPTLEAALQGEAPDGKVDVGMADLVRARDSLSSVTGGRIQAVSLGTPHFSATEFEALAAMLDGSHVHPDVEFYVSTSREVLRAVDSAGVLQAIERFGAQIVTDTCTYVTPILRPRSEVAMTNSAKWAYYAPGNVGVEVVFGSTRECVRSAVEGRVVRDPALWGSA
jgi:predicted aconitase